MKTDTKMMYKDVPLLMYHDIGDYESPWCVSPAQFEQQLRWLKEQGYTTISLDELKEGLERNTESTPENGKGSTEKVVILTFDDGRKGVYTYAYPLLRQYGFTATLFIVPHWIAGKDIPAQEAYSQFLSWEEVQEMAAAGFCIGSHSLTHRNLTSLPENMLQQELQPAEAIIFEKIQRPVRHFAYPYGQYNEPVFKLVQQRYATAVTTRKGFSKETGAYARQWILRATDLSTFQKLLLPPTVSLCMIVKDEEQHLPNCLHSVQGLVDEIIIVDTGSTDRTKEIARSFGAKVFDFTWCDDFAAARNESLKQATGDWILVLDADEELDEGGKQAIGQAIQELSVYAYVLPQLHYTNTLVAQAGFVPLQNAPFKGYFVSEVIRLFRNSPEIRFQFCVHETIFPSLSGKEIISLPAAIHHLQEEKGTIPQKQEYYFRLSLKNIEQYPTYAKSYNDVAIYYQAFKNDQATALAYCQKAVALEPANKEYLLNLSYRLRELQRYDEALEIVQKALALGIDERVLRALGFLYYLRKQYADALKMYQTIIDLNFSGKELAQERIEMLKKEMAGI